MIHPVRPVGVSVSAVPPAVYAVCWRMCRPTRRCLPLYTTWVSLPLAVILHRRLIEYVGACGTASVAAVRSRGLLPLEPWKPWPAHPPSVDEVARWWPSDEVPPTQPSVLGEDQIPQLRPVIVELWGSAGAIDLWA